MLREWLGGVTVEEFGDAYFHRAAIAQPASAKGAVPLLDWAVLDRVLGVDPEVLVVAQGQLLPLPPPRSVRALRAYFSMGVGLCLRHGERCDPGLRRVADAFETDVGEAHVQLFITPAGTHGFGWHYDDEDVFIAQTAGRKDYYFRENTIARDLAAHSREFQRYHAETSPLHMATLLAGDFLYLPARWWHMAVCHEDALSISVGVSARGASLAWSTT